MIELCVPISEEHKAKCLGCFKKNSTWYILKTEPHFKKAISLWPSLKASGKYLKKKNSTHKYSMFYYMFTKNDKKNIRKINGIS